jgi:hypothetical protein
MRDDVRGAHLPERREEDLIYLGLEFGVLKNKLAVRRGRKMGEEYVVGEHHSPGAMP